MPPVELCRPGYALLTHSSSWWTEPISWITGPPGWKHVAVFTHNHLVVEAVGGGVHFSMVNDVLAGCSAAAIVKPPCLFSIEDQEAMIEFLDEAVAANVPYDWWSVLTWLTRRLQNDRRFQCAELVFAAWDELLRLDRKWKLPGRRRFTPCPNDVWATGIPVWRSDPVKVARLDAGARAMLAKKGR
jgi:uncharacterized protein YycO